MSLVKPWLVINRKRTLFSIVMLCLLFGLLAGIHSVMNQLEGRYFYVYHETHRLDKDGSSSGSFEGNWGRMDNKTWSPPSYEDWLLLRTELEQTFEWAGLTNYVEEVDFVSSVRLTNMSAPYPYYGHLQLYAIPPPLFEELSSLLVNGTLPQQSNEVIFCRAAEPLLLKPLLDTSLIVSGNPGVDEEAMLYWDNQTLEITGILSRMSLDLLARQGLISEDGLANINPFGLGSLLTREDFFFDFLGNFSYFSSEVEGNFEIRFDFSSFKVTSELLEQAGKRLRSRQSLYLPLLWYNFRVDLTEFAENFIQDFEQTKLTFVGFGLPVLTMGGILILKTTAYGAQSRKEEMQLLYRKGLTLMSIRLVMLVELSIQLLTAAVIGSLAGLALGITISSQEILPDIPLLLDTLLDYFHSELVFLVLFLGVLAAFLWVADHNLIQTVKKNQYSTSPYEEVRPAWIRHYWDIFGLGLGVGGVLGALWAEDFFETQLSEMPSGIETFFQFISYSFLFVIFLSILLLGLRILGILIKRIGTSVWERSKGTMTLPFWRFSQGITDYWGSLAVFALLILLVVSGFGALKNTDYHAQESAHFRVGADIRLILDSNASKTLPDEIREVSAVSDVTLVTRALWNTRTREVRALVISPGSFVRTIHQFKSGYFGLPHFENHLRALQRSGYVLIDRGAASTLDWTKGTNYTFGLTPELGGPTISLHCEAQFDRFPSFVLEEDRKASSDESVISMV
ncbi:MAG: FtsX-like permease family protein, partial [Candidatus Hodarchaeales archaeon]